MKIATETEAWLLDEQILQGISLDAGTAGKARSVRISREMLDSLPDAEAEEIELALLAELRRPSPEPALIVQARWDFAFPRGLADEYRVSERRPSVPCITTLPSKP